MFFEGISGLPAGQVPVAIEDLDDGVIDIGWDLLTDVTPRKWQKVPADLDAVKRDWTRWYLDENAETLDVQTLLAMFVLADNDLPYEIDVDYVESLTAFVEWLRGSLAGGGFDVTAHSALVTDVRANVRNYLADLPGPAPRRFERPVFADRADEDEQTDEAPGTDEA